MRLPAALAVLLLAACAGAPQGKPPEPPRAVPPPAAPAVLPPEVPVVRAPAPAAPRPPEPEIYRGTGSFIDSAAATRAPAARTADGRFTLNFKGADVREVIRAILGDLLQLNFAIDERVKGQVSVETRRPISRDEVLPTLEALLRANGAVLSRIDGVYHVVPGGTPAAAPHFIVTLRYIAAREMEKILRPLSPPGGLVLVDPRRNLLVLAGSQAELAQMRRTVEAFDVDQLEGMSVGLFRLAAVDMKTVRRELEEIFGEGGEGGGMLRFVPLERLNGFLVITPQPKYLDRVQEWVRRLDRADEGASAGLHVYYVQNSRATHLAEVLGPLFGVEAPKRDALAPPSLAPGARPAVVRTDPSAAPLLKPPAGPQQEARPIAIATPPGRAGAGELDVGPITIIADDKRNALIVKASAPDYAKIEQVIRKLDIWPLQVLVEATIVDVALTDELSLGVEWFLKGRFDSKRAEARLDLGAAGIAPLAPGFSYTVIDAGNNVRAVLNALATESKLKVVSSPTMMVLDNHKASIRVGDQVPVRTSEATSIATSAASPVIASTFDYRDTGVLLEVTPRVNASGMVTLEIHQEVNDVSPTVSSGIDSPTINQRRFTTTVAVQDGETVVLGGLIRDRKIGTQSGMPFLSNVPLLGWLFKSRTDSADRSELIVVITPSAVRDQSEARAVTDELQRRMSEVTLPAWLEKKRQLPER